jgi:signal peptidase I
MALKNSIQPGNAAEAKRTLTVKPGGAAEAERTLTVRAAYLGEHTSPAPKARPPAQESTFKELLSLLLKIGVIAGVAALMLTFVYGLHRNTDPSMAPAVKDGDLVAFYRFDKGYEAGDLLALEFQGERQIRRVVAIAGDTVDITEDGLMINGAIQQEPEIYEATYRYEGGAPLPLTLGEGQIYVLGDSRENATDSRVYGAVNTADTLGKVVAIARRRSM